MPTLPACRLALRLLLAVATLAAAPAGASPELIEQGDRARSAGQFAEAARHYEAALQSFRASAGERAPDTLAAQSRMVLVLGELGRNAEQLTLAEEVLKLHVEVHGPRHTDTITAMNNLALAHSNLGHHAEAMAIDSKVLKLGTEILGEVTLRWRGGVRGARRRGRS